MNTAAPELAKILQQLEASKEQAIKKFDEEISAIKLAMSVAARMKQQGHGAVSFPAPSIPSRKPEGLTDAVRSAIRFLELVQQEFDVRDIESCISSTTEFKLPEQEPRTRIAMVLQNLMERGEIERTFTGKGRIPHRYKAKEAQK